MFTACEIQSLDVVQLLIDAGAAVDIPVRQGQTALMCAAQKENDKILKALLKAGADVNRQDRVRLCFDHSSVCYRLNT